MPALVRPCSTAHASQVPALLRPVDTLTKALGPAVLEPHVLFVPTVQYSTYLSTLHVPYCISRFSPPLLITQCFRFLRVSNP